MPNAEFDTPTSGDLNEGDAQGRRLLEGLWEHLRENGSLAGSFTRRSQALGGAALRRFVAEACREFRGQHDIEGDLIRLGEKFSSGFTAITIRELRVAAPERPPKGRRAAIIALRAVAGAGAGAFAMSESGTVPHWVGIAGALVAFAAAGATPGIFGREKP